MKFIKIQFGDTIKKIRNREEYASFVNLLKVVQEITGYPKETIQMKFKDIENSSI